MKKGKLYTSIICIVLILALGGYLLYLKLRRYRHDIDDAIENHTPLTKEDMTQPSASYDTSSRGYRNNNPLNIRINDNNNWVGEVRPSTDGSFCQFVSMAYGFRAGMVCIRTYITKHKLTTISEIIGRWAPWTDGNNPTRYAKFIVDTWPNDFPSVDTVIDYTNKDQMTKLAYAMAIMENGSEPLMSDIYEGFDLM